METQKRIAWIDMAKGYGMILVILGHCGVGDLVNWINSFHMPLFFFLSGYVFNPTGDFKTFLKKKARSILIPYLGLGIPLLLYSGLCQYIHSGSLTVAYIIHLVSGFVIQRRMYTLWFLACLFFLNIMFYLSLKILKTNAKLSIFSVISVLIGLVYYKYIGLVLPWNIDVCFMAFPFFFVGYYYKNRHEIIDKYFDKKVISIILFVILLFVNISLGHLSRKISGIGLEMYFSYYGCPPLTYLSAFAGIACVVIVSKWITIKPIQYIGENSILYFAWHQTMVIPFSVQCLDLLHMSLDSSSNLGEFVIYKIAQLLIILAILTLCNFLISRTRLRILLRK